MDVSGFGADQELEQADRLQHQALQLLQHASSSNASSILSNAVSSGTEVLVKTAAFSECPVSPRFRSVLDPCADLDSPSHAMLEKLEGDKHVAPQDSIERGLEPQPEASAGSGSPTRAILRPKSLQTHISQSTHAQHASPKEYIPVNGSRPTTPGSSLMGSRGTRQMHTPVQLGGPPLKTCCELAPFIPDLAAPAVAAQAIHVASPVATGAGSSDRVLPQQPPSAAFAGLQSVDCHPPQPSAMASDTIPSSIWGLPRPVSPSHNSTNLSTAAQTSLAFSLLQPRGEFPGQAAQNGSSAALHHKWAALSAVMHTRLPLHARPHVTAQLLLTADGQQNAMPMMYPHACRSAPANVLPLFTGHVAAIGGEDSAMLSCELQGTQPTHSLLSNASLFPPVRGCSSWPTDWHMQTSPHIQTPGMDPSPLCVGPSERTHAQQLSVSLRRDNGGSNSGEWQQTSVPPAAAAAQPPPAGEGSAPLTATADSSNFQALSGDAMVGSSGVLLRAASNSAGVSRSAANTGTNSGTTSGATWPSFDRSSIVTGSWCSASFNSVVQDFNELLDMYISLVAGLKAVGLGTEHVPGVTTVQVVLEDAEKAQAFVEASRGSKPCAECSLGAVSALQQPVSLPPPCGSPTNSRHGAAQGGAAAVSNAFARPQDTADEDAVQSAAGVAPPVARIGCAAGGVAASSSCSNSRVCARDANVSGLISSESAAKTPDQGAAAQANGLVATAAEATAAGSRNGQPGGQHESPADRAHDQLRMNLAEAIHGLLVLDWTAQKLELFLEASVKSSGASQTGQAGHAEAS